MPNKKMLKLIIAGTFLVGAITGTYVSFSTGNKNIKAETIILDEINKNKSTEKTLSEIIKNDSTSSTSTNTITESLNIKTTNQYTEYIKAIGWTADDKLLVFKNTANSLEGDKIITTITLDELTENGEFFKTHEIKFEMDQYNKNLISDYYLFESSYIDNVEYIVSLSPDKEKVLISAEILNDEKLSNDQYRITNKGYSAICNLKTDEVTLIDDNSRFIRWSSDSKNVFGMNYIACYYKYMDSPYNQHFFPSYTYRNISYNIADKKVNIITENKDLYETLTVTRDTYDTILNKTNIKEKKRFLIGYTGISVIENPKFKLKKILFNNNSYNLNHILDITEKDQYLFIGNDNLDKKHHGAPAIYIQEKENGQNKKIFQTYISNTQKILIHDGNLLYEGETESSFYSDDNKTFGLCIYNLNSNDNILLYEGNVGSFAYSPNSNLVSIYDDTKKSIFVGKLINNKLTDLKSYFKVELRAFDMYFNDDGTKLFFEGSYKDINGVIDLKSGEVTEVLKRKY